jgi:hypothetical protein
MLSGLKTSGNVIERVFTATGIIRSSLFCGISTGDYCNLYPTLARRGDLAISNAFDYAMSLVPTFKFPICQQRFAAGRPLAPEQNKKPRKLSG